MGPKGVIFPEGSLDDWNWRYVKVIPIPDEEQVEYPVPDQEGKFYKDRLDIDNAKTYGQYEFIKACKDMGITIDKPNA